MVDDGDGTSLAAENHLAFSSPSCSYIWLSLQLQARIFRSPLRDQDLLVRDEKLNLVVQLVLKKRMQMLLDGQFRRLRKWLRDQGL